ncbi:biotin--[acetyl-CoA-carboxylase] ligase [Subtercola frigoramans]|uniref:biotin--[biotin carboxyl-carrier protein] ligase n=1 Tax=Subtercola frigoramans TaxID=120298 RepID=A0ABS2L887_9MICO|nr:biotin--[acetyl-CoA-carboxylase] ligase [Subtercola frigoramans]MBM7473308.1 BirA family biotin operon repressor/biotin-[acetyl-CoA-carboxylase] ligase [Subtercola frigoramans]
MHLPASRSAVPRLEWLGASPSTNSALVELASGDDTGSWPDLSVVVTDNQTAGRGRLGREWVAPAGRTLAISVLLRPGSGAAALPFDSYGWIPLFAGVAMARALRPFVDTDRLTTVKWPNDVQVDGLKISGILSELVPGTRDVVVGAGVNLYFAADELPVATATSLSLVAGSEFTVDEVLSGYLRELTGLYRAFVSHGGDAVASGIASAVTAECGTLGRSVRVELPDSAVVTGIATGLDSLGRLVVAPDAHAGAHPGTGAPSTAAPLVVSAGDVTHLRH